MDFYKQRRFICEITGHSGLTFFEALQSEATESRELNSAFPDALKEPILRRVQFSTVSRVDHLVDEIFEEFKQDFYPGEHVTTVLEDNTRLHGIIRDKMSIPRQYYPDGGVKSEAYARYLIRIDRSHEEALLDQDHITRDRKTFSKQMLRAFIKNNTTRESWSGAPWLVKPNIAEEYKIETEVPKHLQYGARVAEKKAMKKADQEGHFGFFSSKKLPELKPATGNAPKVKLTPQELARNKAEQFLEYQRSLNGDPSFLVAKQNGMTVNRATKDAEADTKLPAVPTVVIKTAPPPPPVIKYPIEDLDLKYDPERRTRPKLSFSLDPYPGFSDDSDLLQDEIKPESVSHFLETWNTLNVYCEVFQLDSFTFDDFVEAIRFSSEEVTCELFVEVHCAVLKKLVNASNDDDGAIQVSLPDLPHGSSDDSGSDEEEEEEPNPEPEPVVTRMTTRSSLAKAEAANLQSQLDAGSGADLGKPLLHRAVALFERYDWIDKLRKRDFRNGGWELIMAGLLNQLSVRPKMEAVCEEILKHLIPVDIEPTQESVGQQYLTLNVNLRIRALQIICMLSLETKAIRNYLEECSNQMTEFRKEKIEHQRARKLALEELRKLHAERKEHEPEPEKDEKDKDNDKSKKETPLEDENLDSMLTTNAEDDVDTDEIMDTEDDNPRGPSLRGGVDRIMERKRRREAEKERREQLAKQPKGSKQYQKIMKKIDEVEAKIAALEDEIAVIDNDLREADCPRTRCLGKDRFCNRYWWFERNGMPYEGLPNSSTADAKYANGRLWVQGPDDMEREGFLELPENLKKLYAKEHRVSPAERKAREEGGTSLPDAHHWAYYDESSQLDELIKWLDAHGIREMRLRKELQLQRDFISKHMENRRQYLTQTAERAESEEIPAKRMSTRTKTYVDDGKHRCLKWKNTTALNENGHLHVDAARPTKRAKRATDEPKELKATSKQTKSLSRQGSRYKS
ncbi:DDT domain protein [Talaromyces stipitatus ATCC 10500]|uniref:DDT domain protein n=1 Tax=Talaromyces stipitatus (strain ATCC 10500 / CBS 375.48 / QM 6759 / NRRL 1006) TaxID=441959 RepID=B8MPW6_TALSN|nr:DDT domain protein [Talaromyces stipitatus ATCC 10500]EED12856.1 DDT domain protein [Talaromyces stipitatus ATCC 10500]